ncbi:MAG: alkaline phosphatase family protein [Planctomycetota bacterium]
MQNYPGQPWTPDLTPLDDYPYLAKHDPFSSFAGIVRNPERWKCIVDEYQFWSDVINGQLPNYAWFTPNMWNDGHYVAGTRLPASERAPQLVNQTAAWLQTLFAALQFPGPHSRLPPHTLVVVTFDEADYEKEYVQDQHDASSYDGPNQIYTVLLGDGIP